MTSNHVRDTEDEIAVTGIGLVTPAGIGSEPTWQGLLEGLSTATVDPELTKLAVDFTCRVAAFTPEELLGRTFDWQPDRAVRFALVAAREAVIDAGLRSGGWDPTRVAWCGERVAVDPERREQAEGRHGLFGVEARDQVRNP